LTRLHAKRCRRGRLQQIQLKGGVVGGRVEDGGVIIDDSRDLSIMVTESRDHTYQPERTVMETMNAQDTGSSRAHLPSVYRPHVQARSRSTVANPTREAGVVREIDLRPNRAAHLFLSGWAYEKGQGDNWRRLECYHILEETLLYIQYDGFGVTEAYTLRPPNWKDAVSAAEGLADRKGFESEERRSVTLQLEGERREQGGWAEESYSVTGGTETLSLTESPDGRMSAVMDAEYLPF